MKDWLKEYSTPDGFDFPRLLHDDHIAAVKLLFNARKFVSCAKLLLSYIDTMGYLAWGDQPRSFQRWLETYVELTKLGVTPEELWEYRNSLLHMTNSDSRKVIAGKVRRLIFYVGPKPEAWPSDFGEFKAFDLFELLSAAANGTSRFLLELNNDPARSMALLQRYDQVLSDVRYQEFDLPRPVISPRSDRDSDSS